MTKPPLIYLATPYSHPSEGVMEARFDWANEVAAHLFSKGFHVFSPVSHCHPINGKMRESRPNWEFWRDYDLRMLHLCDAMFLLKVEGWSQSSGVIAELSYAHDQLTPRISVEGESTDKLVFRTMCPFSAAFLQKYAHLLK